MEKGFFWEVLIKFTDTSANPFILLFMNHKLCLSFVYSAIHFYS